MSDPAEAFAQQAPGVDTAEVVQTGSLLHGYRADIAATSETVRLLTVAPDVTDEAIHDAFEAAAANWHNPSTHPNIVTVHDRGQEPRPWIAVDRVAGERLPDVRDDLSIRALRTVVDDVAEALRNAALYNTLHGDLTPAQIWVTDTDHGVQAIVDDWGLERACRIAAGDQPRTPYTAPECREAPGNGTQRADIYSLGAVTYYALTGQPPDGSTHRQGVADDVTPPSTRTEYDAVTGDVDEVIHTALAHDPDDRYDSAYAFQTAITTALPATSDAPASVEKGTADEGTADEEFVDVEVV